MLPFMTKTLTDFEAFVLRAMGKPGTLFEDLGLFGVSTAFRKLQFWCVQESSRAHALVL